VRTATKKVVFGLVATVFPLVFLVIGCEIVLRVLEPPPPASSGEIVRASEDADKQYELAPGSRGMLAGASVAINSFGCRDREHAIERTPGVVRIVGIGDSLTFGQGVEAEQTYLARLEAELTARHLPVEIINCGVFGYNVNEETERFSETAGLLKPDIMIIGYELGDLLPNPPYRKKTGAGKGGAAPADAGGMRWRGFFELFKRSRLVTFLAYRYSFLLKKLSLRNWDSLYADGSPLWKNLNARYDRMAGIARTRGIDVAVVIVPELSNLDDRYPFKSVHARVAEMCRSRGMRVIDLLPSFLGQDGPSLWVHPRDRHPNARGHSIMAQGVVDPIAAMVGARMATLPAAGAR